MALSIIPWVRGLGRSTVWLCPCQGTHSLRTISSQGFLYPYICCVLPKPQCSSRPVAQVFQMLLMSCFPGPSLSWPLCGGILWWWLPFLSIWTEEVRHICISCIYGWSTHGTQAILLIQPKPSLGIMPVFLAPKEVEAEESKVQVLLDNSVRVCLKIKNKTSLDI